MKAPPSDKQPFTFSTSDVCSALNRMTVHKAASPGGIPGRVLRACAEQSAGVFLNIFNLSLAQAFAPTSFMTPSIKPMLKHSTSIALNNFCPVALTRSLPNALRDWLYHTSNSVYHPQWTHLSLLTATIRPQMMPCLWHYSLL